MTSIGVITTTASTIPAIIPQIKVVDIPSFPSACAQRWLKYSYTPNLKLMSAMKFTGSGMFTMYYLYLAATLGILANSKILIPRYSPSTPCCLIVFLIQSKVPKYFLLCLSSCIRVFIKSVGYVTKTSKAPVIAPAKAPFMKPFFSVLGCFLSFGRDIFNPSCIQRF